MHESYSEKSKLKTIIKMTSFRFELMTKLKSLHLCLDIRDACLMSY